MQHQLARTQQQVDRYATELQRHGIESVEREVRWLSELINAERHGEQSAAAIVEAATGTDTAAAVPTDTPQARKTAAKTRKTSDKPRR